MQRHSLVGHVNSEVTYVKEDEIHKSHLKMKRK